jgi:hypothetical protein
MKEVGKDEMLLMNIVGQVIQHPIQQKKFVKEVKRFYCYKVRDITKLTLQRCNI